MENSKSVFYVDFTPFGVNDPKEIRKYAEYFQKFRDFGLFPNPKNLKDSNDSNDLKVESDIGKFLYCNGSICRVINEGEDYYVVEYPYPSGTKNIIEKINLSSMSDRFFFVKKFEDLFLSTNEDMRQKMKNLENEAKCQYGQICKN